MSFFANLRFAASTSLEDLRLPSPNLFKAARGGKFAFNQTESGCLGLLIAALIELMATVSRSFGDAGIVALLTPPNKFSGNVRVVTC